MSTSSQEPRGQGLSSTLVSDFRAILNSLEQEKAAGKAGSTEAASGAANRAPVESKPASAAGTTAATSPVPPATPGPVPPRRLATPERPAPAPYSDVRSQIAALGQVNDLFPSRPAADSAAPLAPQQAPRPARPLSAKAAVVPVPPPSTEPGKPIETRSAIPAPAPAAAASNADRRRGFGATRENAVAVRRRRSSSSDVITWKRLGVLAVCMAFAGGGAMALQSIANREEAKVAPEAIGNAAIATVAPSSPMAIAAIAAPVAPEPVAATPAFSIGAAPAPTSIPNVAAIVADVPQPVLRNAEPVFDAVPRPSVPTTATAFVAPDAGDVEAAAVDKPKLAALPKQAPLPPPAPRQAVAAAPAAVTADVAEADAEAVGEDAADGNADTPSVFGGDPVGTATIRSSVTMRAQPKRGAAAIGNLQSGQKVELVACDGWCEVVAEGKRGFIYKSFVDTRTARQADAAPQ